jgi:hypothetical protein
VKENPIWVDSETLVNVALIEYIKFGNDEARLSFYSGEPLFLKGESALNLRKFMETLGIREFYKTLPPSGPRKGIIA